MQAIPSQSMHVRCGYTLDDMRTLLSVYKVLIAYSLGVEYSYCIDGVRPRYRPGTRRTLGAYSDPMREKRVTNQLYLNKVNRGNPRTQDKHGRVR